MTNMKNSWLTIGCALVMAGCQLGPPASTTEAQSSSGESAAQSQAAPPAPSTQDGPQLIIRTSSLPVTYPRAQYSERLVVQGGVNPYHWKVEKGELPPGLRLEDEGTLHGSPEKLGEYRFTISVTDSGKPPQSVERDFVLIVIAALSMQWKVPAHVTGNRIDGSVQVTNTTAEDFDFTFVTLAVSENGRATAIGYQHFPLKKGTTDFEIAFGDTLPHGAYVVHVDGVAEVPEKNQIHRSRLQTAGKLQVVVGP